MSKKFRSKLLPLHHSVGDWDKLGTYWRLDENHYISPPTSLFFYYEETKAFLCRLPDSLCLPVGRLVGYFRYGYIVTYSFTFRNQAPLGTANISNTYMLASSGYLRMDFGKRVADVYTLLGQWPVSWGLETWYRYRLTWWNAYNPQNVLSLAVQLEREEDGVWVDKGILYDTDNLWADSDVNRVGLTHPPGSIWFDDTEIWIPKE